MGPDPQTAACRLAVRRCLADLPSGALVLAACSGGADSYALAVALAFEGPRAGLRAGALTVDHGLQPGSDERAERVARELRALALDPVEVLSARVGGRDGPEGAARAARYAALEEAARRHTAATVLLGHTRDDQAETVLLGLARGSGARSLSGMRPRSGRYRRPLLDLPRATTLAACREAGLVPWEDPHNADPAFARARVRHAALPALEETLGPGVADALSRSARLLRDDADALDAWAERAAVECARPSETYDVAALAALPAAVRRRVLRAAALGGGAPPTDLACVHIDALEALVLDWHGQRGVDLPGGLRGWRRGSVIGVERVPR